MPGRIVNLAILKGPPNFNSSSNFLAKLFLSLSPAAQFHIGHIHYLQGRYGVAREVFEGILATKSVPNTIRAMTLRQLGECK